MYLGSEKNDHGSMNNLNEKVNSLFVNIEKIATMDQIEIYEESEASVYICKLMERMVQMKESIENIEKQTETITTVENDDSILRKNKMLVLTELFNEVHLMCGEVRQILSNVRTFKKLEMKTENITSISQAEEEISKILELLSKLKRELHEKISIFIESVEKTQSSESKTEEELSFKSATDTDCSHGTDTTSSKKSSDSQIKFISDYMQTLIKNIEEIQATLNEMKFVNEGAEELKDKISDLRVLERHLNRNEPLVKEIEFWLCHDFSKPSFCGDNRVMVSLKLQYEKLCDMMLTTNSLVLQKNELLHKELELAELKRAPLNRSRKDIIPKSSSSDSSKTENKESVDELKSYRRYRRKEKKEMMKDIDEAIAKISKLSKIIDSINQTIEDNKYFSVINDSIVAQQGYICKIQADLLNMHKDDYEWLLQFTNSTKLCNIEVPDQLFYQIMDLKVNWNATSDRVFNVQENLSRVRELWILFEYYTVRIILWNKAVSLTIKNKDCKKMKKEAEIIQRKIKRVNKIKARLLRYVSLFSQKIINKLWEDTESEFHALVEKL